MTVTRDFHYKVWIIEDHSHGNTQTLLLEAVSPLLAARGQRIGTEEIRRIDLCYIEEENRSSDQINRSPDQLIKGPPVVLKTLCLVVVICACIPLLW
jgi:hypothetical protein